MHVCVHIDIYIHTYTQLFGEHIKKTQTHDNDLTLKQP